MGPLLQLRHPDLPPLPGPGAALRAVAYRLIEESVDERGTGRTGEPA